MERNIRHVQRWLERCLDAYRHRRQGAALAELESARAELEIAREMLAEELAGCQRSSVMAYCVRVALVSFVILFALVLPTSRQNGHVVFPVNAGIGTTAYSFEKVTEEEQILPENLRRPPGMVRTSLPESLPEVQALPPLQETAADCPLPAVPEEDSVADVPEKAGERAAAQGPVRYESDKLEEGVPAPSVEEVLSLLQVGQRALQNPRKGIPIQP